MGGTTANPKEERALLVIAALSGFAAVVTYPLALAHPQAAALLVAIPIALATSGRLRSQRTIEIAAIVVAVAIFVGLIGIAPILLTPVVLLGPVAVLYLVGTLLMAHDRVAGVTWLTAAILAAITGIVLVGASPNAATGAIVLLAAIGVPYPVLRIRRRQN